MSGSTVSAGASPYGHRGSPCGHWRCRGERGWGQRLMLSPCPQSQRAAALGVLFALIMLLIIYSSGNGSEVFPYSRLRGRARRPPDLKKWGVKSGYLPVCGNKVRAGGQGDIRSGALSPAPAPSLPAGLVVLTPEVTVLVITRPSLPTATSASSSPAPATSWVPAWARPSMGPSAPSA